MDYGQLLYQWLAKFADNVYRGQAPSGITTTKPYIQFDIFEPDTFEQTTQPLIVWQVGTSSYKNIENVCTEIKKAVGDGIVLKNDNIAITIFKGNPYSQDYPQEVENVKAKYINLIVSKFENN